MASTSVTDPGALTPATAKARLGALKSRGVAESDPRVGECRAALAFWHCKRVIAAEVGQLSAPAVDELVEQLRGAVACDREVGRCRLSLQEG